MSFILLIILALVVLFLLKGYKRPESVGKRGEIKVHNILSRLPEEFRVMDDVILKTVTGTTQIDHVVVSRYGVFAIETKNYRGKIYGYDNSNEWTQIIVTPVRYRSNPFKEYTYVTKNKLYNPVKQSLGHANAIKKALYNWPGLKVVPIVVFVGDASLANVHSTHHVIYGDQLLTTIQNYTTEYLSDINVAEIVYQLSNKNVRQFVSDRTHVENVRKAQIVHNQKISSGICPRCGGKLIKREGQYGTFYGCSNYPKCKFTN